MVRPATGTILASPEAASAIPLTTIDNLAQRLRPGGLFVLTLDTAGNVTYHDASAAQFFLRYVLPSLQDRKLSGAPLQNHLPEINAASGVALWKFVPGVTLAVFPYVDRRQVQGIVVLAGRNHEFSLTEDLARTCSQLAIDGEGVSKQASALPAHSDEALSQQARLLLSMLRDQVRQANLEGELDALTAQLSNTYEELTLMYQLSSGMRINRSVADFFKRACLDVLDMMGLRGMGVALGSDGVAVQQPVLYGPLNLPLGTLQRLADKLMGILRETRTALLVNNVSADERFGCLAPHAHQLLAVPLLRGDQVLGCVFGIDKTSGEFDSVDNKLLSSIANESAIYLENFMLYDDVRGLMMGLLHSLVSAVDAKDAYTCGHSERVALLSRLIAQEARLGAVQVERVYMAGLLHDVGKIGVPEAVLQKTGKLTPEEFEQIKMHPEIGARILGDIKQLQDILPGVLHHHERYDGKGYPHGLAGESIPLLGRIICLADCFDAMTSSRTYRKALPLEVALTELRRCAGTQFDPALADAFLRVSADQFRELLTDHKRQTKQLIDQHQRERAA